VSVSYIRRLKNARKNAQREIDRSKISGGNYIGSRDICLKHSYPLWIVCRDLHEFDYVIWSISAKKYKSFARVARAIFRKGRIITYWDLLKFNYTEESDLRKINSSTYNMTKKLFGKRLPRYNF